VVLLCSCRHSVNKIDHNNNVINPVKSVILGSSGNIMNSNNLQDWHFINGTTLGSGISSIVVNSKGVLLGIYKGSHFIVSYDKGAHWDILKLSDDITEHIWLSVAVNSKNEFVAVGFEGTIISSADGKHWALVADGLTAINLMGVSVDIHDNFLAVGFNGLIMHSADGDKWNIVSEGIVTHNALYRVAVNKLGRLVAIGGDISSQIVEIFYSDDGVNWYPSHEVPAVDKMGSVINIAVTNTGNFIAVSNNGSILSSEDGDIWYNRYNTNDDSSFFSVSCNDFGSCVAASSSGAILKSDDVVHWKVINRAGDGALSNLYSGVFDHNKHKFVAVGSNGTILNSTDGDKWDYAESNGKFSDGLFGINVNKNSQFVAVGDTGTIITSNDGDHWQNLNNFATKAQLNAIII
jgi:photosystem II stability/assembly factor-like uncharacterized protein